MDKKKWQRTMWSRTIDAQHTLIVEHYGQKVADDANYGWGDASQDGRIDVATKVYGHGVLVTRVDFPSQELQHTWD